MKKLPKTLYVRIDEPQNGDAWFSAEDSLEGSVTDDGPTDVGVYQLVEMTRVDKVMRVLSTSKRKK